MKKTHKIRQLLFILFGLTFMLKAYASTAGEYTHAKNLYENQDHSGSYAALTELIQRNYSDINVNFYLALSAARLDKTNEAIAAYERILMIDSAHAEAKIELAKIYYQKGENRLAEIYLRSAFHPQLPEKRKAEIRFYLSKINRPSWSGTVIFGIGHDSNVNHASDASSWFIPLFGEHLDNSTETTADSYHQEMVTLNHFHDVSFTHGFAVNNQLQLYSKKHVQQEDYDLLYLRYNPTFIVPFRNYQFATGLHYDHLDYGGKAYLQTYGINPKLLWKLPSNRSISTQLKLAKTHYLASEDEDRNALFTEFSGQYSQTFDDKLTWLVNLAWQGERKEKGTRFDVDYNSTNLLTKLSYKLPGEWQIGGTVSLKQKQYQDISTAFKSARQDSQRTLSLNVSKSLHKHLVVQAQVENTLNQSNHSPFEFDKRVVSLNFLSQF